MNSGDVKTRSGWNVREYQLFDIMDRLL
jgi:hypothetical protein